MSEVGAYSIVFAAVGLVLMGISIPLIMRKVPPNSFYGCRTRKTLSNRKIWYDANHISGKDFCISGAIVFVAS
ncbi:MAG: SdpI family protein, partial [bacterium]